MPSRPADTLIAPSPRRRPSIRSVLILPIGFLILIVAGTILLRLPHASVDPAQRLAWHEAMFTAINAVCVTGLTVRDTAVDLTGFGQATVFVLFELGAMAVAAFGALLAVRIGAVGGSSTRMVRFAFAAAIAVQAIGALVLMATSSDGLEQPDGAFDAILLAGSAFCQAGYGTLDSSSATVWSCLVVLMLLGSIGFPVLLNLCDLAASAVRRWAGRRRNQPAHTAHLTPHSKATLTATAILLAAGAALLLVSRITPHFYDKLQLGQTAHVDRPEQLTATAMAEQVTDAAWLTVTSRSTGLTPAAVDTPSAPDSLVLMTSMFIGGGAGSPAGGIKVTVLVVLVVSVTAMIRRRRRPHLFGRPIAAGAVRCAAAVLGLIGLTTFLLTAALCLTEQSLLAADRTTVQHLLLESVSAVSTTGLRTGLTEQLSTAGQSALMAGILIGRLGPVVLAAMWVFGRNLTAERRNRDAGLALA